MNPMNNLRIISLPLFKANENNEFHWELWYDCCGGFIGLKDLENEYNVYSTEVKYDLEELIQDAEKANKKILENIDTFKNYVILMTVALCLYKDTDSIEDFNEFEKKANNLENWLKG